MSALRIAGALLALAVSSSAVGAQAAQPLPDGRYTCTGWIGSSLVTFGFVDIKGMTYRGPSHTPAGPFKPYTVAADGNITWTAGFGGFTKDGQTVNSTKVMKNQKAPTFEVAYRTARGHSEGLDCKKE